MSGRARWFCAVLAATFVLALSAPGFRADLTPDDLMNIHGAWNEPLSHWVVSVVKYWSPAYRPMGSLFLGVFFHAFGFNPLPYRVLVMLVLGVNALLVWRLARELGAPAEAAPLAAALASVHPRYQPLYYNTGQCYDIFCFLFYLSALLFYVHCRRGGGALRAWQWLAVLALYVCALDSKELAVTLPLLLVCYELVFHRPPDWRALGGCLVLGLLTVPYVIGKTSGNAVFFQDPAYTAELSVGAYFRGWTGYLNELLFRHRFDVPRVAAFLLVTLALCWRSRTRLMGWLLMAIGMIPLALVPPRGLAAVYLPMAGLALVVAGALAELRERLLGRLPAPAWLALVLALLAFQYVRKGIFDAEWIGWEQRRIRGVISGLRPLVATVPPGGRVLMLHDPFADCAWGRWSSEFLLRLLTGDHDAGVQRLDQLPAPPNEAQMREYAAVFDTVDGRIVRLR